MKQCPKCQGWQDAVGRPFGSINPCHCKAEQIEQENEARDEAIDRVGNNNAEGRDVAYADAVRQLSQLPDGVEVSSYSLWPDLTIYQFTDNRAAGAVTKALARDGYIKPTTQFKPSPRVGCHKAPMRIYLNTYHERNAA